MTVEHEDTRTSVPEKKTKKSEQCPLCQKEVSLSYRPFCSKRCKMVDLYKWVSGHYVIPGAPAEVVKVEEQEAKEEWEKAWNEKDF